MQPPHHLHHLYTPVPDKHSISPGLMYLKTGWVSRRGGCGAGLGRGAAPATKPQPAASYAKDGIFSQWGRPAPAPPPPLTAPHQASATSPQSLLTSRCQRPVRVTLEGMVDCDLSMQGVEKVKRRGDVWVPLLLVLEGGWVGVSGSADAAPGSLQAFHALFSSPPLCSLPPSPPCHHPPPPPKLQLHPKICHCNTKKKHQHQQCKLNHHHQIAGKKMVQLVQSSLQKYAA